mgnify:CR=1 FL=1
MPYTNSISYVCVANEIPLEWFQTLQSAIDFAENQPFPVQIYSAEEWDALVEAEIMEIWEDYFGKEVLA